MINGKEVKKQIDSLDIKDGNRICTLPSDLFEMTSDYQFNKTVSPDAKNNISFSE